jgi:hypothetical protein
MATLKQSHSFGANRLAAHVSQAYAGLAAGVGQLLGAPQVAAAQIDTAADARAAQLFAQALHEDSNLELDWLWYATNMTSVAHRRYCLRRALEINPDGELAQRALSKLSPRENM